MNHAGPGGAMSGAIRIRACLAVVREARILLVTHFPTDGGPIQWVVPGGGVAFGEGLRQAARREFGEETGLEASVGEVIDVTETIRPAQPWHSITITFAGEITGGMLRPEVHPHFGERQARWLAWDDLPAEASHPKRVLATFLSRR
jgi:ADP-ribose pyrophosphatase YjhB (NUDIX family)